MDAKVLYNLVSKRYKTGKNFWCFVSTYGTRFIGIVFYTNCCDQHGIRNKIYYVILYYYYITYSTIGLQSDIFVVLSSFLLILVIALALAIALTLTFAFALATTIIITFVIIVNKSIKFKQTIPPVI